MEEVKKEKEEKQEGSALQSYNTVVGECHIHAQAFTLPKSIFISTRAKPRLFTRRTLALMAMGG